MSRIKLDDTFMDALVKMAEGNPGAIAALMEIMTKHNAIDPQAALGGMGAVMMFDTWEIYGTDIYILFNDKCGGDVRRMLMLMRATQLGFFGVGDLKAMAADQSRQVDLTDQDWDELDNKVCNRLERFARPSETIKEVTP